MYCAGYDVDTSEMLTAIKTVEQRIKEAEEVTFAQLDAEVFGAKGCLNSSQFDVIRPGCDLFKMRITKQLEADRNDTTKKMSDSRQALIERCGWYYTLCEAGPSTIVNDLLPFVRHTSRVLVLGSGSCLALALKSCVSVAPGVKFFVLEGCPQNHGKKLLARASEAKLDSCGSAPNAPNRGYMSTPDEGQLNAQLLAACSVVPDAAVAGLLPTIDFVVVGSNTVTEHGALVHCPGTLQLAMLAKSMNVPFYALCETFKFSRVFPMSASDLSIIDKKEGGLQPIQQKKTEGEAQQQQEAAPAPAATTTVGQVVWPEETVGKIDLVPPNLFTLLFTEQGIITPSSVAHEVFRIFSGREADLQ